MSTSRDKMIEGINPDSAMDVDSGFKGMVAMGSTYMARYFEKYLKETNGKFANYDVQCLYDAMKKIIEKNNYSGNHRAIIEASAICVCGLLDTDNHWRIFFRESIDEWLKCIN